MTRSARCLLAATLLSAPWLARAQGAPPATGPYVALAGGDNILQSLFLHPSLAPNNEPATRFRFNDGYVVAVTAGWGFGNGFRAEIEGAYDYNSVINRVRTGAPARTIGNQGTYGVLANVFYDIDLTKLGTDITFVQPYVGVGAGVLWTQLTTNNAALNGTDTFLTAGTGSNFAGQAVIGLGFPIKAVPGLKFNIDYRYIEIAGNSGLGGTSFTPSGRSSGTVHISPPILHQVALSFAYSFDHPSPQPPPAPVPAPARAGAKPHLPGILRLGPRGPHRPRPAGGGGGGAGQHAGANHPDRGEWLHGRFRVGGLQPWAFTAPGPGRGGRAGAGRGAGQRHHRAGLRRDPAPGADRSRRAGAAEPARGDHPALTRRYRGPADQRGGGSAVPGRPTPPDVPRC